MWLIINNKQHVIVMHLIYQSYCVFHELNIGYNDVTLFPMARSNHIHAINYLLALQCPFQPFPRIYICEQIIQATQAIQATLNTQPRPICMYILGYLS